MPIIVQSSLTRAPVLGYQELIDTVGRYLKRSDLNQMIPFYISMAEAKINSVIKQARELEEVYTTSTAASNEMIELPPDYKSLKSVMLKSTKGRMPLQIVGIDTILNKNAAAKEGVPDSYNVFSNRLILSPIPDQIYDVTIFYFRSLKKLDFANPSNWLLNKMPDLYLLGALVYGCIDVQDFELLQVYQPMFNEQMALLEQQYGLEVYSGSQIKTKAPYRI